MKVYKITEEQADTLRNQEMPNGAFYNVDVKDIRGNIIISEQQYQCAEIGEEIDYEPIN